MEWIRRRPAAAGVAGVVAVLFVLGLVYVLSSSKGSVPAASPYDPSTASITPEPTLPVLTPTATPTKAPLSAAALSAATKKLFDKYKGTGYSVGGLSSGSFSLPGLQGGSVYQYLPRHRIVLTVTSAAPIGIVGYVIPTSLKRPYGEVHHVGTGWSLTTTVYGGPDYAQLFMQGDQRGDPITCTITVDGKVTEHQTTEGPYARLICQG
jgi:hypothetical protein